MHALALLLPLLACTPDDAADTGALDSGAPAPVDPSAAGAFPIGTDATDITGSWGTAITVQTWFPRTDDQGSPHVYDDIIQADALDGGQAACDGPRPVLMFSHGNQGMRWQSFYLADHFASHGWIVVAPDHTGNTFLDYDGDMMPEVTFRRPIDIADAFDHAVARSQDPEDRLHGCIDADAGYAIMGHSFGGYTTLAVSGAIIDTDVVAATCSSSGGWLCSHVASWAADHPDQTVWDQSDPRAWAAVAFAPAAYETLSAGLGLIDIPTQIQAGDLDTTTPWPGTVQPIWEGLQVSPRAAAHIDGAGHFSFSDACTILPTYPECSGDFREPADVHDISRTLALAWALAAQGDPDAQAWLPPEGDDRVSLWETD